MSDGLITRYTLVVEQDTEEGCRLESRSSVELSTLRRGLEILGLFLEPNNRWDTGMIAERLELTKSTTYKYVQTLERAGFLVRETDGSTLILGPRILELSSVARNPSHVADLAYPILEELVTQTNETALLAARMGTRSVCIARVESRHSLKLSYELGATYPLHAGGTAQVLLAWLDDDALSKILSSAEFTRYTSKTVASLDELRARLAEIRKEGYAMTDGELDAGTFTVAAPVTDRTGQVIASLSLGGPLQRLDDRARREYPRIVKQAAHRVSESVSRGA